MTVTIKHGLDTITRDIEPGTTIGQLVTDRNVKAALNASDNVRALINNAEVPHSAIVPAGSVVYLETRANEKQA